MRACWKIVNENRSLFRVRSKSSPQEFHLVEIWRNGDIICDCIAGMYKTRSCRHREIVKCHIDKSYKKLHKLMKKNQKNVVR